MCSGVARLRSVERTVAGDIGGGIDNVFLRGGRWRRPPPLALVGVLALLLGAVWLFAVGRWLSLPDPGAALPEG